MMYFMLALWWETFFILWCFKLCVYTNGLVCNYFATFLCLRYFLQCYVDINLCNTFMLVALRVLMSRHNNVFCVCWLDGCL